MRRILSLMFVVGCGVPAPDPGPGGDGPPATTVDNRPPAVASVVLGAGPARTGADLTCAAQATDPDGDPVTIAWAWSIDGVDLGVDAPRLPRTALHRGRTLTCTATPHDGTVAGLRGSDTLDLSPPGGNVLVLLVDDLGVDKVGVYAEHPDPPPTPHIDALADEGVLFRRAYAQSVCSPARATLLTGRHPTRHGVGWWLQLAADGWWLPTGELTAPEMLRASTLHAYTSAAIGKWHLVTEGYPRPGDHPLDSGFDHFAGILGNPSMTTEREDSRTRGYTWWERWADGERAFTEAYLTSQQVDDALDVLPELPEPWFGWVGFSAPHSPWHWPPDALHTRDRSNSSNANRYAAMVEALDTEIGRLLDGLGPDLLARTTIVFLSDNGTPEQVVTPPWDPARSKHTPFEGGVRVPMIVTGPLVASPGRESDAIVHATDLLPTLAQIAGVDLATERATAADGTPFVPVRDGLSFLPLLTDPRAPDIRDTLHLELLHSSGQPPWLRREAIAVDATHKVVRGPGPDAFYDLTSSPFDEGDDLSSDDLSPAQQAARGRLTSSLEAWEATLHFDWADLQAPP